MKPMSPTLYFVAGPNGCGKSTLVNTLLHYLDDTPYVCPDTFAIKIRKQYPELSKAEIDKMAWELSQKKRKELVVRHKSFVNESVCSHPSHIHFLQEAKDKGFKIIVLYVTLDSADKCCERVARRVSEGGHNVDTDKIISRYERSLNLIPDLMQVATRCIVFDNSKRYKLLFDKPNSFCTCFNNESILASRILSLLDAAHIPVIFK